MNKIENNRNINKFYIASKKPHTGDKKKMEVN